MRLPNIIDTSCVPTGGLVLPRVNDGSCVSPGGIILPNVEIDGCVLEGMPGPAPEQLVFPGPDWLSFIYGGAVCLHCQGVGLFGTPNDIGGFSATSPWTATTPPSANFDLLTQMIGGTTFEYTTNSSGFVLGSYTGPICHCRLTLTATISGTIGQSEESNFIAVYQNGGSPSFPGAGPVLAIGGVAGASTDFVAGTNTYDFFLPLSVNNQIRVYLQGTAGANSSFHFIGQFTNIA